jgi:hypothetical protein
LPEGWRTFGELTAAGTEVPLEQAPGIVGIVQLGGGRGTRVELEHEPAIPPQDEINAVDPHQSAGGDQRIEPGADFPLDGRRQTDAADRSAVQERQLGPGRRRPLAVDAENTGPVPSARKTEGWSRAEPLVRRGR